MPRAKRSPAPDLKTSSKPYLVSLVTPDKIYKAEADSILEGLEQLNPARPFKGKNFIKVQAGKLSAEVTMYPAFLNRLFVNKVSREILQKRMAIALK